MARPPKRVPWKTPGTRSSGLWAGAIPIIRPTVDATSQVDWVTHTWTHTCAPGCTALVVYVYDVGGVTVTYGGVAMTQVNTVTDTLVPLATYKMFVLYNPPSGTHAIFLPTGYTVSNVSAGGAISFLNTGTIEVTNSNNVSVGSTVSVTADTTAFHDNSIAVFCVSDRSGLQPTANAGCTAQVNIGASASMTLFTSTSLIHPPGVFSPVANVNTVSCTAMIVTLPPTAPTVTGFWPPSARTTGGGTPLTVTGTGFLPGASIVVDGNIIPGVTYVSSVVLTAPMPAHVAGSVSVSIINPGGITATAVNLLTFYAVTMESQLIANIGGLITTAIRRASPSVNLTNAQGQCKFIHNGPVPPSPFQSLQLGIGSLAFDDLIFAGEVQNVTEGYDSITSNPMWSISGIDYLFKFKRRLVFKQYTSVTADVAAQDLLASYGSGFTGVNIQTNLPVISALFSGIYMDACMAQLAQMIGGYWYLDRAGDIHLYLTEAINVPDTIDLACQSVMLDPPMNWSADTSQIRNSIYGTGAAVSAATAVAVSETIVPITDATNFSATGGVAATGIQRFTYTGVQANVAGTVVGLPVAPVSAPSIVGSGGAGIEPGVHNWAYTYKTAGGESLPSPIKSVTLGPLPSPNTQTPVQSQNGNGPDPGVHYWGSSWVVAGGGETPMTVGTVPWTVVDLASPGAGTAVDDTGFSFAGTGFVAGDTLLIAFTSVNGAGETTVGPTVAYVLHVVGGFFVIPFITGPSIPVGATSLNCYVSCAARLAGDHKIAPSTGNTWLFFESTGSLGAKPSSPSVSTALMRTVGIAVDTSGAARGATALRVYRTKTGAVNTYNNYFKVADYSTGLSSITDAVPDASLGAVVPALGSVSATIQQATIGGLGIGPAGVTQRKVYRTAAGGTQLKLQQTVADNTSSSGVIDTTADASLGANVPTSDTSGLSLVTGTVGSGSTSILVAGIGTFSATGGWASIGNGTQIIRYTGISASAITGIPATGVGAIIATVSYGSTITAIPALTGVPASGVGSVVYAINKGDQIALAAKVDSLTSQAIVAALEGGDGIHEYPVNDAKITSYAALITRCQAELLLFQYVIVTATYASTDKKNYPGKPVHIYQPQLGLVGDFIIQTVNIGRIDVMDNVPPLFEITVSNSRFSLEDFMRRTALQ